MTWCMNLFFYPAVKTEALRGEHVGVCVCVCACVCVCVTLHECVLDREGEEVILYRCPLSFKSLIIIFETEAFISKYFLLSWQSEGSQAPRASSRRRDLLLNLNWPLVLVLVRNGVQGD